MQMMKEMNYTPDQFFNLHRWDIKAIKYFLLIRYYNEYQVMKRAELEAKVNINKSNLPKQVIPKRGR